MKFPFKKKLLIAALVPAFGLPLAVAQSDTSGASQQGQAAQGQQTGQPARAQQGRQGQRDQQQQVRDMRASEIIGANVRDQRGEDIGDIQDLIVDADSGRVNYAILAFGGFLGFGEKLFAYPMDRFQASGEQGDRDLRLVNVNEEQLKNAPGFDRSNWPTFGRMGGYRGEVDQHFGQTVSQGGKLVRMSELIGREVHDRAGKDVGEIEDIVVSVDNGRVRYVVLEPGNDLDMGNRLAVLPMNAIQARAGEPPQEGRRTSGGTSGGQDGAGGAGQDQQAKPDQQDQQWYQGQDNRPGQPQDQTVASGGAAGSGAAGTTGQARGQQDRQQAQRDGQRGGLLGGDGREMHLVLNADREQLRNARTFESGKWPNLNDPAFRRDMDRYVASFPRGQQRTTGDSAQGEAAAGADEQPTTGAGADGAAAGSDNGAGGAKREGQPQGGQAN